MKIALAAITTLVALAGGLIVALSRRPAPKQPLSPVYVASGYGGFQKAEQPPAAHPIQNPKSKIQNQDDPSAPVVEAYKKGDYQKVEQAGAKLIETAPRPVAANTKLVMAYAAARRKDMSLARDRFAELKSDAAMLPKPAKPAISPTGESLASLEEEAAYQHAVCTAALGEKDEAEQEYVAFMKQYPESPLVHAAVKRVARFHGGNVPAEADAAWKTAMKVAQAHEKQRAKQSAMCAPECLAELLRRREQSSTVAELAKEMATSDEGTTVNALVEAAKKRGLAARGFSATQAGLKRLKLPAIAIVAPGHFVIVEKVADSSVAVWNPDSGGPGKHARTEVPLPEWQRQWNGIVVEL